MQRSAACKADVAILDSLIVGHEKLREIVYITVVGVI